MRAKSLKFIVTSLVLGLTLGFFAANWLATGAQAGGHPAPLLNSSEPQGPQADKPVEQVRKNIQVLKGLPSSQLTPLMNFIGVSLGVKCTYCHVKKGDDWLWESDEKEEKRTARRMMQMVLNINRDNQTDFRNSPVTCYTCHRGSTEPTSLPALPVVASAHEAGGTAAAAAATTGQPAASSPPALPSAEQVLTKYVAAVGGKAAAAKLTTRVLKGSIEQSQGRNPGVEIFIKEPDKYLLVLTTKQQGIIYQGVNGATGWIKTDKMQREMNPSQLAQFKRGAEILNVIKVREPYTGMTVTGKEKVGDRETYVVEARRDGGRVEKYFFDVETGLLLRQLVYTNALLFSIPEQTDFEDYREVDGVKLPFIVRTSNIDTFFSATNKFTEIRHNMPVDDARFNPPPAAPAPSPQK